MLRQSTALCSMPEIKEDGVYMSSILQQYPSENGEETRRGGCRDCLLYTSDAADEEDNEEKRVLIPAGAEQGTI